LIDSHAHLASTELAQNIEKYLEQARQHGVTGVLCVATTRQDSTVCIELAQRFEQIRASVGIHPNNCHQASAEDWYSIEEFALHPQVVAVGETGLDRYWDDCPWDIQTSFLERHIQLSRKTGLPIIIHTRECMDEAIGILEAHWHEQPFAAVMHSFTGTSDQARRCLDLGFYISFAGMVTFKNAAELRKVAAGIPLDRLLIETDSPYLTPQPFRGQRPNHPALLIHTAQCLADARGQTLEELASCTQQNSFKLFSKWNT
jgi:TatD DNase family protein